MGLFDISQNFEAGTKLGTGAIEDGNGRDKLTLRVRQKEVTNGLEESLSTGGYHQYAASQEMSRYLRSTKLSLL